MLGRILLRRFGRTYQHSLRKETIADSVLKYEYAVRGAVAIRAMEIEREMESGKMFPFKSIVKLNIGNPQSLGQKPITFNRQVLACCISDFPEKNRLRFSKDAVDRADYYLNSIDYRATGAYTDSPGMRSVIKEVKEFIETRDGVESKMDNIYLLNGASEGITIMIPHLKYCILR